MIFLENTGVWKDYGQWLIREIGFRHKGYTRLLNLLHDMPFTWVISRDQNRSVDGTRLRDLYGTNVPGNPCSVLEMLVGLAIRVDREFLGSSIHPVPDKFFFEMLSNLNLDLQHDRSFNVDIASEILLDWIERRFDSRGNGSIFPVSYDRRDQRNLEIWDQMNSYLWENYGETRR